MYSGRPVHGAALRPERSRRSEVPESHDNRPGSPGRDILPGCTSTLVHSVNRAQGVRHGLMVKMMGKGSRRDPCERSNCASDQDVCVGREGIEPSTEGL